MRMIRAFARSMLGDMMRLHGIGLMVAGLLAAIACDSEHRGLVVSDGAVERGAGTGGGSGTGGAAGNTSVGGGGGSAGAGGGGSGSGGMVSGGSTGSGGMGSGGILGTGGTVKDAAVLDGARDQAQGQDALISVDAGDGCGSGYPVGSTRPQGDGCNTCFCESGGWWMCTTRQCPTPSDGGLDAPADTGTGPKDVAAAETASTACAQLTSQVACETRGDCHALFADPGTCDCAMIGCCMAFNRCADGGKALCTGNPQCEMMTPQCGSNYVVAYTASCYEGCVLASECAP